MAHQKEKLVEIVRRRPLLAAGVAFVHFPLVMGLWVMATEALAGFRTTLARLLRSNPPIRTA